MQAGRPQQQVAASVHVAKKIRPGVLSFTRSAVSANYGSLFHFWQKWHITHPTEQECCFCQFWTCAISFGM